MHLLSRSWLILFLFFFFASCADEPELTEPRKQDNFQYFKKSDGLASDEVTALYEDRDGNLWIGSYGSVTVYNGTTFKRYTTSDGVIDAAIVDISHDSFGNVWAGSYDGYSVFDGEQWGTEYGLGITALFLDENNLFWAGSFGYGLFQIQENGQINSFELPCEECNYFTNIFTDQDGDVWLTTLGGAFDFNEGQFTGYNSSKGVNNVLTAGACDSWGDLWLGALESDKLNRISDGKVSSLTIPTGEISINRQGRFDEEGIKGMVLRGFHQKRSGDIVFVLDPGWMEAYSVQGTTHGSPYVYDTHVPIIFYGKGVKKGFSTQHHAITDIAPTLSMLLNISLPNGCTGRPVSEMLDP